MKIQIVTTITTLIDLDTFEPQHAVEVNAEDAAGLPMSAIYAAVSGGCRSAMAAADKAASA